MHQRSLTNDADSAARELRVDFDDVEQLCATVRSWDLDFRPLAVARALGKAGRIVQQQRGRLEISYARLWVSIEQLGAPPHRTLTFAVIGQATRRLWWRGKDVDSNTVLAFPIGAELRCLSGPDFEVHTVSIAEETVDRLAERFQLPVPAPSRRLETFRPPPETLAALRLALAQFPLPDTGSGIADARAIGDLLVLAWLRAHGDVHKKSVCDRARHRDHALRVCLARLEHPDWVELSPSVLCEIGGVGERTLQYAFRERFGLTPAAFLKARRLAAVNRSLLVASDPFAKVSDLAARFGFTHTGQFATDYRRAFGEAPSATLNRIRRR